MKASPEQIDEYSRMAIERGGTVRGHVVEEPPAEVVKTKRSRAKPKLIDAGWNLADNMRDLVCNVAHVVRSEANGREWRGRSNRTQAARLAVRRALTPGLHVLSIYEDHYHRGGALAITFVRLGGRKMDPSNLPSAFKAVEDELAHLVSADDGDPRWRASWKQEPGSGVEGVRIELTYLEPE